jgi:hypothetical protein
MKRENIWKLEKYDTVKRWLTQVGSNTGAKSTQKTYLSNLNRYCKAIGKNPDEIIKERKSHLKSDDENVRRQHEEMLTNYFNNLTESISRNSAASHHKTVRSFYKHNYVDLKLISPKSWTTHSDKIPSLEDLKKMIDVCESPLQKALILFSAQSGQRAGVISSMTYGMVKTQLENGDNPLSIHIKGDLKDRNGNLINKNRQEYTFFIGTDAINALKTYVEYMENLGHEFKKDSSLFVTTRKYRQFAGTKNEKATFKPVDRDAVNVYVRRSGIKAGLMEDGTIDCAGGRKRYPIHHHCLRKFWQTAMEQGGIAKPWYEYMMGHSLSKLDQAYSHPSREQLMDAYRRAEPYLTISRLNIPDLDNMKKELLLGVIKQQCQILGFDPARIKIEKENELGTTLTIDEEIEALQRTVLDITIKQKVENNNHEHKIVNEKELTDHLNKGWEIVKELSNHKIVIKSPYPNGACD